MRAGERVEQVAGRLVAGPAGEQVVVYSEKTLSARSRIQVVERIAGVSP